MDNLRFLLHRTRRRWQMLLLLLMSVTLSAALLACGPLLLDAVMRFALPYKLQTAEPLDSNLRLTAYDLPDPTAYGTLDAHLRLLVEQSIPAQQPRLFAAGSSGWLYPWYLDQIMRDQRLKLRFMQDIGEHAGLSAGSWPDPAAQAAAFEERVVYAVVPEVLAQAFDLDVGERLPLSIKENERAPSAWLEVSGILEPFDAQEKYWFGDSSPLRVHTGTRFSAEYTALIDQASFFALEPVLHPGARSEYNWNVLLEPQTIQPDAVTSVRASLGSLRLGLGEVTPAVALQTNLETLLSDFLTQARTVRITLYVVLVEVLFLALYFLNMAAGLAVQQVEGEFASLASRGASFGQVFKIQALEAGLLGLLGWLVGPLLAWLAVWALGRFGPFAQVTQAVWQPRLPWTAWLAAGLGALAASAFLLLPVYAAVQRSVVTHAQRTARPEEAPWWQRAYLDVFAALGAALLAWRVRSFGGVAASGQVDWLLLIAPLALLVSSAVVLLRLFPLLVQGLARLAGRGRGLPAALALWYTARNPAQVVRLVLLLVLTIALGILSSGLELTLDAVERERARYAAGSDLRILLDAHFTPLDLSALQGLQSASRAWRGSGSVNLTGGRSTPQIEILAIEPLSFAPVTRYRADYAEESIGALMGNLILDEAYQAKLLVPLPGKPATFGLWVYDKQSPFNSARLVDLINLQVKLQTAQKESFVLPLVLRPVPGRASDQYVPPAEWRYFEAELPALDPASYPLGLHSLWVKALGGAREAFEILQVGVDDFSVSDRQGGATTVVEDFELHTYMWETNSPGFRATFTRRSPALSGSGTLSLWLPGGLYGQMQALYLVSGFQLEQPLPALASQEFMAHTQLAVGDSMDGFVNGSPVPLVIVGVLRYFPTLYDLPGQSFLVLPRDPLLTILNRQQRNPSNPNEVWLELDDPGSAANVAEQVPGAAGSLSYLGELRAIKADPLTLGLRSVTLLGAFLAALLSLAGFATYFYMSLYRRETTFAILRSLGLSSAQLISMLAVEQLLMILVGLLLGTGLGLLLNRLVLPGLPLSLGGRPPIPPLLPLTDWTGMAQFLIFLLLAFSLVLGSAAVALWRSRLQQLLRIGQE